MFKLIIKQANWGVVGSIFGFSIGFFVKVYLLDIVGLDAWGKYVTCQTFVSFIETFLSLGIPYVIIKFVPNIVDKHITDASKIANELKWLPDETFTTGIKKTVQWYLDNTNWLKNVKVKGYEGERLGVIKS